MVDHVISDLHLDHENIIKYCNRPFESVESMNEVLVSNWNEEIDEDNEVLFLGDLTITWAGTSAKEWLDRLNGNVVFVRGNHDDSTDIETRFRHQVDTEKYRFCCVHKPKHVPGEWDGWVISGHHHNNDMEEYPLINPSTRRINVSVELLEYRPIQVATLVELIERGGRVKSLSDTTLER